MLIWLLISLLLSVIATLYVHTQSDAPHRHRFHITLAALCVWLVPWNRVSWQWSTNMPVAFPELQNYLPAGFLPGRQSALITETAASTMPVSASTVFSIGWLLFAAGVLGVGLFIHTWIRQAGLLRRLQRSSRSGDHLWRETGLAYRIPIRLQNQQHGAFTSGILKPVIWLHDDFQSSPNLKAALLHEAVHVKQHDNAYSTLITFIDYLFWWNPVVRFLSFQARQLQELSCDLRCRQVLPDYRTMLAELILAESGRRSFAHPNMNGIFRSHPKPKIRMQYLENDYPLLARHVFACVLMLGCSAVLLGCLTRESAPFEYMGLGVNPEASESIIFYSASFNNAGGKFMRRILPDENGTLRSPSRVVAGPGQIDALGPPLNVPELGIQGQPPGKPAVPFNVMGAGTMAFREDGILVSLSSAGDSEEPEVFVHHFLITLNQENGALRYTFKLHDTPLLTLLQMLAWSVRLSDQAVPPPVVDFLLSDQRRVSLTGAGLTLEETFEALGCDISRNSSFLAVSCSG